MIWRLFKSIGTAPEIFCRWCDQAMDKCRCAGPLPEYDPAHDICPACKSGGVCMCVRPQEEYA